MKITIFALVFVATLSGCTVEGHLSDPTPKIEQCIDTRDGETFRFNTATIKNIRVGFGTPTCFDILDLASRPRTLCTDMEAWLKCETVGEP